MFLAAGVIVGVVGGGDLHGACTELLLDEGVGYYCHFAVGDEWVQQLLTDEVLVALVFGVYGYGGIAQHGLDTGGGYDDLFCWVLFELIGEVDQHTEFDLLGVAWHFEECPLFYVFEVHLDIRDGGLEY